MEEIKSIIEMAQEIIKNEEAKKVANEMLKNGNDYDLVTKLVYYQFFKKGGKRK